MFTDVLLRLSSSYQQVTMWHTGSDQTRQKYPKVKYESPAVDAVRRYGLIRITGGRVVPFAHALGRQPESPEALYVLLKHPNADKIKIAFDLSDPDPEFVGERDPVPLVDKWPGLASYLPEHRKATKLVVCEAIYSGDQPKDCVSRSTDIVLSEGAYADDDRALELVVDELNLDLGVDGYRQVVQRMTPDEVEERRAAVRQRSTDAERLLAAVGEEHLRRSLPESFLQVLEASDGTLTGVEIASKLRSHH